MAHLAVMHVPGIHSQTGYIGFSIFIPKHHIVDGLPSHVIIIIMTIFTRGLGVISKSLGKKEQSWKSGVSVGTIQVIGISA